MSFKAFQISGPQQFIQMFDEFPMFSQVYKLIITTSLSGHF